MGKRYFDKILKAYVDEEVIDPGDLTKAVNNPLLSENYNIKDIFPDFQEEGHVMTEAEMIYNLTLDEEENDEDV